MMSLSLSLSSPFAKHQYRGCVAAVARDLGNDDGTENTNVLFQKENADENRF
jgi:hypothetical protein